MNRFKRVVFTVPTSAPESPALEAPSRNLDKTRFLVLLLLIEEIQKTSCLDHMFQIQFVWWHILHTTKRRPRFKDAHLFEAPPRLDGYILFPERCRVLRSQVYHVNDIIIIVGRMTSDLTFYMFSGGDMDHVSYYGDDTCTRVPLLSWILINI